MLDLFQNNFFVVFYCIYEFIVFYVYIFNVFDVYDVLCNDGYLVYMDSVCYGIWCFYFFIVDFVVNLELIGFFVRMVVCGYMLGFVGEGYFRFVDLFKSCMLGGDFINMLSSLFLVGFVVDMGL